MDFEEILNKYKNLKYENWIAIQEAQSRVDHLWTKSSCLIEQEDREMKAEIERMKKSEKMSKIWKIKFRRENSEIVHTFIGTLFEFSEMAKNDSSITRIKGENRR